MIDLGMIGMAFVYEKDNHSAADKDRGLRLKRVGGIRDQRAMALYDYEGHKALTCRFWLEKRGEYLRPGDEALFPPDVKFRRYYHVRSTAGEGSLHIPGFTRQQSLTVIEEALICLAKRDPGFWGEKNGYLFIDNTAAQVSFGSNILKWAEAEVEQ